MTTRTGETFAQWWERERTGDEITTLNDGSQSIQSLYAKIGWDAALRIAPPPDPERETVGPTEVAPIPLIDDATVERIADRIDREYGVGQPRTGLQAIIRAAIEEGQ